MKAEFVIAFLVDVVHISVSKICSVVGNDIWQCAKNFTISITLLCGNWLDGICNTNHSQRTI